MKCHLLIPRRSGGAAQLPGAPVCPALGKPLEDLPPPAHGWGSFGTRGHEGHTISSCSLPHKTRNRFRTVTPSSGQLRMVSQHSWNTASKHERAFSAVGRYFNSVFASGSLDLDEMQIWACYPTNLAHYV